jgi:hypothetical protein
MIVSSVSIAIVLNYCGNVVAQSKDRILEPQSCVSTTKHKSRSSLLSTNVQFINRKPFRVKVYWIDFSGKRQHYFDLEPNQSRWQQTFTSHPWVITNSGENQPCLRIFLPPSRANGIAIID